MVTAAFARFAAELTYDRLPEETASPLEAALSRLAGVEDVSRLLRR